MSKTDLAAKKFVQLYYKTYDENRKEVHTLYMPQAVIVWNGRVFQGVQTMLDTLLNAMPATVHHIQSIDTQSIKETGQILITVTARICFAGKLNHLIHQQFTLTQDQTKQAGLFLISADCLRFV